MCYTRRKIEGGVGALRESVDTNFLKPNSQSRNLNIYAEQPLCCSLHGKGNAAMKQIVETFDGIIWSYSLSELCYQ